MIRQNDPRNRWVNGSTGYVRKVDEETLTIELLNGREVEMGTSSFAVHNADGVAIATATNFPVNLAYASTIHKAQGATLDRTFIDLSFAVGAWASLRCTQSRPTGPRFFLKCVGGEIHSRRSGRRRLCWT